MEFSHRMVDFDALHERPDESLLLDDSSMFQSIVEVSHVAVDDALRWYLRCRVPRRMGPRR
ncbi:MAG: hypothetical protein O7D32_08790 [bacterium]|nr:hypothetical protein [bacterium]